MVADQPFTKDETAVLTRIGRVGHTSSNVYSTVAMRERDQRALKSLEGRGLVMPQKYRRETRYVATEAGAPVAKRLYEEQRARVAAIKDEMQADDEPV